MKKTTIAATAAGLWLWRRQSCNTSPSVKVPGTRKSADTMALEAGSALLQGRSPLAAMNLYLDGFHFFADDMGRQIEAHHYCSHVNEEFTQCVIFDGNRRDARLIGIEYIISEDLFATLPEEEKKLWHSHHYEVSSGTLVAAGIPEPVEHRLMEKVIRTYGKTWNTWNTVQHELPLGTPSLMMGFTAEGQLAPDLLRKRDERFGISSERLRKARGDIPVPTPLPGSNAWEDGRTFQLTLEERDMRQ